MKTITINVYIQLYMTGQHLALWIAHHHLAELIKVHGAGAVLQTTDHLLFFCWLAEKLSNFVGCYLVQLLFVCLFVCFVGCYLVQLLNDSFQLLVCERGEQLSCTKS